MNIERFTVMTLSGLALLMTLSISSCTLYMNDSDNRAVIELVKAGAHPLAARCAIRPDERHVACAIAGGTR